MKFCSIHNFIRTFIDVLSNSSINIHTDVVSSVESLVIFFRLRSSGYFLACRSFDLMNYFLRESHEALTLIRVIV